MKNVPKILKERERVIMSGKLRREIHVCILKERARVKQRVVEGSYRGWGT